MSDKKLILENCINKVCPWSGDPVNEDSLMYYKDEVIGFCNPGCRDKFKKAVIVFEEAMARKEEQS